MTFRIWIHTFPSTQMGFYWRRRLRPPLATLFNLRLGKPSTASPPKYLYRRNSIVIFDCCSWFNSHCYFRFSISFLFLDVSTICTSITVGEYCLILENVPDTVSFFQHLWHQVSLTSIYSPYAHPLLSSLFFIFYLKGIGSPDEIFV
jgi:hypothetical protein